jgi:hypothetical protein
METIISEKTLIPISAIAVLIGGVFWISSMYAQGRENANAIIGIKQEQKELKVEIREDLRRLEDKIDLLLERKK